jgi:hypothetical protein
MVVIGNTGSVSILYFAFDPSPSPDGRHSLGIQFGLVVCLPLGAANAWPAGGRSERQTAACLLVGPDFFTSKFDAVDCVFVVVRAMGPLPAWAETRGACFGARNKAGLGSAARRYEVHSDLMPRTRARQQPAAARRPQDLQSGIAAQLAWFEWNKRHRSCGMCLADHAAPD